MNVPECDGTCCAVIPWRTSPQELRRIWEEFPDADWDVHRVGNGADSLMIADMLVPISDEEAHERSERFGVAPDFVERAKEEGMALYKCKNWDEDTKLCTKYESRPDMCAAYPYERPCEHCGASGGCASMTGWRKREESATLTVCSNPERS